MAGMKIGYDAKRAFHNGTGLGHYSRTLIRSMAEYYPENDYYLYNPKPSSLFTMDQPQVHEIRPAGWCDKLFPSLWRSNGVKKDLKQNGIQIYHGLSHEIPLGIEFTGIPSVVTMHDLIHERYPEQYSKLDVKIYSRKFRNACKNATAVIAISEQTKRDLIEFYGTPERKIRVCYQSCNEGFTQTVSESEKLRVKQLYQLPERFFLYVGSLIERKNLLSIAKALPLLHKDVSLPLVVIGDGAAYKETIKNYLAAAGISNKVLFMSENKAARTEKGFRTAADFPAIYQQATAMIYPSTFEGFGIPVLEALWSRIPVITSNVSCLPEAGGPGAFYVDPLSPEQIAAAMTRVVTDAPAVQQSIATGYLHAQQFTRKACAEAVMNVYLECANVTI